MLKFQTTRELRRGTLDLYWATLDDQRWRAVFADLCSSLSIDELSRARRFKFREGARRYILCRGILRRLIGLYAGTPPSAVSFCYSTHGKPYLVSTEFDLKFNLSHAGEFAVFAFSREDVGVDIENICSAQHTAEAIHIFVSDAELAQMREMSANERQNSCLHIWTRKEALLKAIGVGLIDDMRHIFVGASSIPAVIATVSSALPTRDRWAIQDIGYFSDTIGAVAFPQGETGTYLRREFYLDPGDLTANYQ